MPMLDRAARPVERPWPGSTSACCDIAAAPELVLQRRVSLSSGQKAMVAVRSLAGTALRSGPPRPHGGSIPMTPGQASPDQASPGR